MGFHQVIIDGIAYTASHAVYEDDLTVSRAHHDQTIDSYVDSHTRIIEERDATIKRLEWERNSALDDVDRQEREIDGIDQLIADATEQLANALDLFDAECRRNADLIDANVRLKDAATRSEALIEELRWTVDRYERDAIGGE